MSAGIGNGGIYAEGFASVNQLSDEMREKFKFCQTNMIDDANVPRLAFPGVPDRRRSLDRCSRRQRTAGAAKACRARFMENDIKGGLSE